ncbi:Rci37p Ecym_7462 [Eremothecium cymbalariae DBVPG|uniref:Uncharacterized protein n=1 Tax=Eremothecium cymbalariae (strain CBS 270.75 / DBVPG 7215 / KCTC 17166 / NRRL Y-17582) TaxID=931890 RepID=G8JWR6_ERECY|nr:hypothetical protein Ecym_7462 [Eremothecium cymbalariae DBVPG\
MESEETAFIENVLSAPVRKGYKAALEFYKKDSYLEANDRLELYKIYLSISRAQLFGGLAGFGLVFGTPFAYQMYKTNAIRGVNVKRSFLLGLISMVVSTQYCSRYVYNSKLENVAPMSTYDFGDGFTQKTSQYRQYEMMLLLKDGTPSKWAVYFYDTYQNPAYRFPDPKVKLHEMMKRWPQLGSPFMNQRDPIGLYSDTKPRPGGIAEKVNVTSSSQLGSDDLHDSMGAISAEDKNLPELSAWDRIRQRKDVTPTDGNNTWEYVQKQRLAEAKGDETSIEDVVSVSGSQQDFDALLEEGRRLYK